METRQESFAHAQAYCFHRQRHTEIDESHETRAVLTCLGALGPQADGPMGVGAIVLFTGESGNAQLGPNQGET